MDTTTTKPRAARARATYRGETLLEVVARRRRELGLDEPPPYHIADVLLDVLDDIARRVEARRRRAAS